MTSTWSMRRFRILVYIVCVAGMSQGLLLPLLTTMLDGKGVTPSENGLSAAALYLGMLLATPFCPMLVKRWGYKKCIIVGLVVTALATVLFPVFTGYMTWIVLRFCVGAGDSILHYASQLWITTTAPQHVRGRRISQYGFAYGLGFGIGPLGMNLLSFGEIVPFLALLAFLAIGFIFSCLLDDGKMAIEETDKKKEKEKRQLFTIYRLGIVALIPPLIYGVLEAGLAGNFPVIGLREGLSQSTISILISAFVWGSLLFQVPLGILGDKIGRKWLLIGVCFLGCLGMLAVPYLMSNAILLFIAFTLIGGLVGSLFSLGLAFLTDLLPARYMPVGNSLASIHFSTGSILGPYIGGIFIEWAGGKAMFFFIASILALFVMIALVYPIGQMQKTDQKEKAAV